MDVRISTRHVNLSDGFRRLVDERVRKLTKYEPRLTAIDMVFEEDHGQFSAEARADVPGQPPLVARSEANGRRKALDEALRKLGRQLRRERSKRVEHQTAPPAITMPEE